MAQKYTCRNDFIYQPYGDPAQVNAILTPTNAPARPPANVNLCAILHEWLLFTVQYSYSYSNYSRDVNRAGPNGAGPGRAGLGPNLKNPGWPGPAGRAGPGRTISEFDRNPGRKSLNRYKQNIFQQNFITTNNINWTLRLMNND